VPSSWTEHSASWPRHSWPYLHTTGSTQQQRSWSLQTLLTANTASTALLGAGMFSCYTYYHSQIYSQGKVVDVNPRRLSTHLFTNGQDVAATYITKIVNPLCCGTHRFQWKSHKRIRRCVQTQVKWITETKEHVSMYSRVSHYCVFANIIRTTSSWVQSQHTFVVNLVPERYMCCRVAYIVCEWSSDLSAQQVGTWQWFLCGKLLVLSITLAPAEWWQVQHAQRQKHTPQFPGL